MGSIPDKKESVLYIAEQTIKDLKKMQDALNSYAKQSGKVDRSECPIIKNFIPHPDRVEDGHGNVASFLVGGGRWKWGCPFCGEEFTD